MDYWRPFQHFTEREKKLWNEINFSAKKILTIPFSGAYSLIVGIAISDNLGGIFAHFFLVCSSSNDVGTPVRWSWNNSQFTPNKKFWMHGCNRGIDAVFLCHTVSHSLMSPHPCSRLTEKTNVTTVMACTSSLLTPCKQSLWLTSAPRIYEEDP